ncbi:pyridoxal 5'-phosphate synthase [Kribbella sp. CA-293567]|uniref:pyridoxal 5'-phosphate synthase n=1 Tax=Kribbella sp. CA-293567 TaxID=3002436 RepID=UPI0022DE8F5B|nr:pyridoxal 5'-phosphate synthase [Kribbella sp. CA-293567]WBQ05185.1 pyridoxal 5'-phosphate synthase [Kribbella sp. CA-293567]
MSAPAESAVGTEFSNPPAEPIELIRAWYDGAVAAGVLKPAPVALATADANGHASTRMVSILAIRDTGLVFASHVGSRKGREITETGWASGVWYWRELDRQVIVSGPTHPLSAEDSDAIWAARPVTALPMSVATRQSAVLEDEEELRSRAQELSRAGSELERPATWLGYLLEPASVEFWQTSPDHLYPRLRYERTDSGWHVDRLQP